MRPRAPAAGRACGRPARRRARPTPPSRTTCAPATRAARAPARRGHGSAAPYGCAGSAAASTSASSASPPRSSRSRSTAPGKRTARRRAPRRSSRGGRSRSSRARAALRRRPRTRRRCPRLGRRRGRRSPAARTAARRARAGRRHCGKSRAVSDQRPCVEVEPAARVREKRRGLRSSTGRPVAARRAKRRPGVVRHLAGPDELPQCGQRLLRFESGRVRAGRARTRPTGRVPAGSRPRSPPSGDGAPAGAPRSGASERK